jgi:ribonuclease HI
MWQRWWSRNFIDFTQGEVFEFVIPIQPTVINNQAEYEALLRGLQYLKEAKAISVEIFGDLELVIKQLNGQYKCRSDILRNYYEVCKEILKSFQLVILQHIPRENNEEANRLAQSGSGYRENQEVFANDVYSFGSDLAIPLKKVTSENIVEFVKEHIIYKFGIPQTITTDQGTQFTSLEFREFAESMGIKLLNLLLIMLKLMVRQRLLTRS